MNKLAVVLGVAAVATLAGCKDPEYARNKPDVQNEVKSIETESGAVESADEAAATTDVAASSGAEEITVEEVADGGSAAKCTCAPGAQHDKPCTCGAPDCKCDVAGKGSASGKAAAGTCASGKAVAGACAAGAGSAAGADAAYVAGAEGAADAGYTVYIVQKGDYLAKISKKYNIKIDAIKKLNNMTSDNIRLGQKIKLPGKVEVGAQEVPAGAVKATPKKVYESYTGATKDYVVVAGDTLGKIAYSNGMNIRQLKELNGLTSDLIKVGQKLKVAAAGAAVASAAPAVAAKTAAKTEVKPAAAKAEAKPVGKETVAKVETKAAEAKSEVKEAVSEAEAKVEAVAEAVEGATNYVVQEGDDLPTIAIEFRVPVARLRELNNLGEGDEVKPGQVLKIPAEM